VFFGSLMRRDEHGEPSEQFNFFLDTVFVVHTRHPYGPTPDSGIPSAAAVDQVYVRLALEPRASNERMTLYNGRMFSESPNGMFSWVPCLAGRGGGDSCRFARPMINQLFDAALGRCGQLPYRRLAVSPEDAWNRVRLHCERQGLNVAVEVLLDGGAAASS
jgi:hypothetical protein